MGCDGGTIPKRHELVRMKKKPEQKDKDMARNAKWSHCAISQEELKHPIVACELGGLYNKEAVIEFLLEKVTSTTTGHIRSLKDVRELKLTRNAEFEHKKGGLADQYNDTMASEYICPVVGIEMNGKYRFCFLWKCGCAMSEKALKEVPGTTCHKCGKPFEESDVVYLNPEGEELEKMRQNMDARRLAAKLEKKAKKEKKNLAKESATNGSSSQITDGKEKYHYGVNETVNGLKRPATGDKLSHSQNKREKSDRMVSTHSTSKAGTSSQSRQNGTTSTVDTSKRSVYKNLFTSSEVAKGRSDEKKAHWVTYNPYHL